MTGSIECERAMEENKVWCCVCVCELLGEGKWLCELDMFLICCTTQNTVLCPINRTVIIVIDSRSLQNPLWDCRIISRKENVYCMYVMKRKKREVEVDILYSDDTQWWFSIQHSALGAGAQGLSTRLIKLIQNVECPFLWSTRLMLPYISMDWTTRNNKTKGTWFFWSFLPRPELENLHVFYILSKNTDGKNSIYQMCNKC